MATYVLVDTANTFFRARHVIRGDLDTKVGMAFHITLAGVRKAWNDFKADHVVFCLEGRSWRKDFYEPYKRNRSDARAAHTEKEEQEDKLFWEAFDTFKDFVGTKTNCSVLQNQQLEADDLIAGWVQAHPNDNHVIISTDGDFAQLISPNVKQYNGVTETTITHEGYFDKKGLRVIDKKTKLEKPAPIPEFMLFEKCMRGDKSDNVFSAFPGVRVKGTKNKVGLTEAFADKDNKGFNWNNMMLQRWVDHNGVEHRVLDDYNRNVVLCDLTAQPANIRSIINDTIEDAIEQPKQITQVGLRLMKFCALWDLQRVSEQAQSYAEPLQARYIA
jgi:5'-3' exonuclease